MTRALNELESKLDHRFSTRELLVEALVHPSFAAETQVSQLHNQRLEFLGDAVLQLVVTRLLFESHADRREGDLSKLRAALCQESSLARLAQAIGLGEHLRLGRGEEQSGGRERVSNLADAFEAVLGAIYLDGGLAPVEKFLASHLEELIGQADELLRRENAKGSLQELTQRTHAAVPTYRTVSVVGPEHQPVYRVAVEIGGEHLGEGEGKNRKAAECAAAASALRKLAGAPETPDGAAHE